MTTDNKPSPHAPDLDEDARRWLALLYGTEATDGDRADFEAWLGTSDAHRAAFERAQALWSLIGQSDKLEKWNAEVEGSGDSEFSARPYRRSVFTTRRIAVGGAIAASLALVLSTIGFDRKISPAPEPLRFVSAIAETKTVRLDDGTVLTLSGASEAQVVYTEALRQIALVRGSAYFDFAGNPERPMRVAVADTEIKVVGTVFGVRYGPNDISVAVTEGRVAVSDSTTPAQGASPRSLEAGQRIIATLDGTIVEKSEFDIETELSWIEGRFIFDGAALVDVVDDINRYRVKQIHILGDATASMEITTSFKVDQIEQFLAGLPAAYDVEITERYDRTIIRAR